MINAMNCPQRSSTCAALTIVLPLQQRTTSLLRWVKALRVAALTLAWVSVAGHANAIERGITPDGRAYVSGGVALDELDTLKAEKSRYTLWVTTAAKKSGAYLADVQVSISDAKGAVVLDVKLDGPWLMADLPPGRYKIDAVLGKERSSRTSVLKTGATQQVVFYFDTGDEVATDTAPADTSKAAPAAN